MQYYRCKCGESKYYGSDSPRPCQGCPKCGTTYAQHPDRHKPIEPHQYVIKYKDDGTPYEWCTRCYEMGKTLRRPFLLPGQQAHHSWITDECRTNHGDDGATEEVIRRLREALAPILKGWKIGSGATIHIGMSVERPTDE